ncbi:MAG: helix-turn-helix domain-containing protein [Treponema sp.]|nr:helix-turn-helix domain-containing protein [Treponema sp.]
MSLEKTVIDNIKRIRKEKGITQEQLAEACNTATSYIGLMEIYRNVPKLSTIEKIANALEVEPQILFQKVETNSDKEKKIELIKNNVMQTIEKELIRLLRENLQ